MIISIVHVSSLVGNGIRSVAEGTRTGTPWFPDIAGSSFSYYATTHPTLRMIYHNVSMTHIHAPHTHPVMYAIQLTLVIMIS